MGIYRCEHCLNGRTHIWLFGLKVLSWGTRHPKPFRNPKLGVSYSVWDGEELLEQSIKQIRPVVDYVNVVWQRLSWYGRECNPDLEEKLLKLKSDGLIDELIFFEPDLTVTPSYNEVNKRNVGLRAARRAGCTHFMTMDTDEFYDTQQFADAWADIVNRNLTHTACNIVNYINPTLRYRDYGILFIPFIHKINCGENLRLGCLQHGVPCLIDPTRQIPLRRSSRFCFLVGVVMHHMLHVRKNIIKKIENSSFASTESGKQIMQDSYLIPDDKLTELINQGHYIPVPNKFDIQI